MQGGQDILDLIYTQVEVLKLKCGHAFRKVESRLLEEQEVVPVGSKSEG